MIKFLLIDLDNTILDFHKAERIGLENTLRHYGVESTAETVELYKEINAAHWRALEQGKMTRKQVNEGCFTELFRVMGGEVDGEKCAASYLSQLALTYDYLPGAEEAIVSLSKKYRLFVADDGTASVQFPGWQLPGWIVTLKKHSFSKCWAKTNRRRPISTCALPRFPVLTPQRP